MPVIGASGAIAAVMGAYLVSWPKARIKTIIFFGFVLLRKVEAIWLLLYFLATQFLLVGGDSAVAWAAHVGGFAFGVLVGLWWRRKDEARRAAPSLRRRRRSPPRRDPSPDATKPGPRCCGAGLLRPSRACGGGQTASRSRAPVSADG